MATPTITDKMPTEGQFVAFWYNDGIIWAEIHRYKDGKLQVFDCDCNWVETDCSEFYEEKGARFIV